jgi:hypothetical protein
MIRITIACLECRQVLDGTYAVSKVESMVAAFNAVHLFDSCGEEPHGGEAQEEPVAGSHDEGDGGANQDGRGNDGGEVIPRALKH